MTIRLPVHCGNFIRWYRVKNLKALATDPASGIAIVEMTGDGYGSTWGTELKSRVRIPVRVGRCICIVKNYPVIIIVGIADLHFYCLIFALVDVEDRGQGIIDFKQQRIKLRFY